MTHVNLSDLVVGAKDIPSPPEIFFKINSMINSQQHSAADIGRIISNDTALTARLLRLANSVFYGLVSRIDTISRAIAVIGTRELHELILATSIIRVFKNIPSNLVCMSDFWRHSIGCAMAARSLMVHQDQQLGERFFVAGLLHDVGSLLVYRKLPELAREALTSARHENIPLCLAEQNVMGFDHAMVGAELLRSWQLPENIQEAVEFHHIPSQAPRFGRDAALIYIANAVSQTLQMGSAREFPASPMDLQAMQIAQVPANIIPYVLNDIDGQFLSAIMQFSSHQVTAFSRRSTMGKGRK